MAHKSLWRLAMLTVWLLSSVSVAGASPKSEGADPQLLFDDRVLLGTVVEVRGDQAQIDIGELQPRFVWTRDTTRQ